MATTTFSKEEKAAMRAAVAEKKAAQEGADAAAACEAAIAAMTGTDKELAETFHQLVQENTSLAAKTWYGMPAYADADGKVVVAFKPGSKFKNTELGRGTIDWPAVLAAAAEAGTEWYLVEQNCEDGPALESIRISYEFLRERGVAG